MENMWNNIEQVFKLIWLILISIFAPIKIAIIVLTGAFALNFFIGFKNDQIVHGRDFSLEKAFKGAKLLFLFYALSFIIFMSISLYGEHSLAGEVTKFFAWIVNWWYVTNILRNAKEIFPDVKVLQILYDIVTIQVFDMIFAHFGLSPLKKKDNEKGEN